MNRKLNVVFVVVVFFALVRHSSPQVQKRAFTDSLRFNSLYEINPSQIYPGTAPYPQMYVNKGSMLEQVEAAGVQGEAPPLSVYGFDLFSKGSSDISNETSGFFVLPPDYRLGPGDRIGIYLLGNVQENFEVTVNVEGKVLVPPAGVIHIWGLKMDEFKALLSKKFSQYYDNYTVDIMLLQPKNVLISVVGDVVRPGKYVLSALNTVLDAIILAGGPTKKGSLRDIQLIRDEELFASVDLYQFLMSGNQQYDVFLEAGDQIFVPLSESKVSVTGEVRRPSIFELKPGGSEKITDVIELAGGFTEYAFEDKIEISRLKSNGHREVLYVNYREIVNGDSSQNILLKNEDKVQVYSKLEQVHRRKVSIFGEVRRPGTYVLEDNMRLSDLILKAGNLTRKAYTLEAEVAKIDPGKPTRFLRVNLDKINRGSNGQVDILLEEDDQVFVRQIPDWEVGLTVEVQGEVQFPGTYSIVEDSTYLSEILQKAGGFTEDAFIQEAFVLRPSTRIKFDKEFDRLKDMRRDEMSDLEYQYFVMRQNSADVHQVVLDFEKLVYQHDRREDIILEDGDVIVIPKAPQVVTVTGRVSKPGGVTFVPDASMLYYLAKAGGASWDADLRKTKIVKVTGEVLDDEDVKEFHPGDIIWVPRKSDRKFWPVALQTISVMAQLASIYLIIDTAINR
ncbi:MAG: SLBB domain-containing protein [bacterium]